MPEAVIVSALRTPIGTARKGTLRDTDAFTLADHVVAAVADGLDPSRIDDVVLGEGRYGGGVLARHAAVAPSTATGHLHQLVAGGLLAQERQGRHRYLRISGPATAEMIESLASHAPLQTVPVR